MMKPLADEIRKGNMNQSYSVYILRRIRDKRFLSDQKYVTIYQRFHSDGEREIPVAFEVVIIRFAGARVIGEKTVEEHWAYPSNEQFGTFGWTFPTEAEADQKFEQLTKEPADG